MKHSPACFHFAKNVIYWKKTGGGGDRGDGPCKNCGTADGYDDIPVREAVGQMLDALEAGKGLTHESRVLIKPNLVTTKGPDTGVTTHPSVIAGVIYWLKKQGVSRITVADPAAPIYRPGCAPYTLPAAIRSLPLRQS